MTKQTQRMYEMLIRVRDFRSAHRAKIPAGSMADHVFDKVQSAIDGVKAVHADLISARGALRENASAAMNLRRALRKRVNAIVVTTRGILLEPGAPSIPCDNLPRCGDFEFSSCALVRADFIEPHAHLFVGRGMPDDFLAQFRGEASALKDAWNQRGIRRNAVVETKSRLDLVVRAGFTAVRQLDGIILNLFGDDEVMLRLWKAARRVDWWQHARKDAAAPSAVESRP